MKLFQGIKYPRLRCRGVLRGRGIALRRLLCFGGNVIRWKDRVCFMARRKAFRLKEGLVPGFAGWRQNHLFMVRDAGRCKRVRRQRAPDWGFRRKLGADGRLGCFLGKDVRIRAERPVRKPVLQLGLFQQIVRFLESYYHGRLCFGVIRDRPRKQDLGNLGGIPGNRRRQILTVLLERPLGRKAPDRFFPSQVECGGVTGRGLRKIDRSSLRRGDAVNGDLYLCLNFFGCHFLVRALAAGEDKEQE